MHSGGRGRRFLVWFGSFTVLLLGLLLIAPLFIPADYYKEQAITRIEQATGRNLEIRGDMGIRFLPRLQLTLGDVHLGNPAGFEALPEKETAALKELQLSLGLIDLLQGRVAIDRLQLVNPVIYLSRNAKGEGNWVFTPQEEAAESAGAATSASAGKTAQISIPGMEIVNGTIIYRAAPEAEPVSLNRINARLELPALDAPTMIQADTLWNDDLPLKAELRLDTPAAWMNGRETGYHLTFTGDGDLLALSASGTAFPKGKNGNGALAVQGETHLTIGSIKELSARLGSPVMQTAPGEGALSLRGMFSYAGDKASLSGLTLSVDDMALNGSASVDLAGPRPAITANLGSENVLQLDSLLNKGKPRITRKADTPATAADTDAKGWSTAPLLADTAALKAVDAALTLSIGGIRADHVELGKMALSARLQNGTLNVNLPEFAFYGGSASGKGTLTPIGKNRLRISKSARLKGADIGQFLQDAQGFDRLSGKGDFTMDVTMEGASMSDFMASLDGNGTLALQNGAIKGFNLAKLVREARTLVQSLKNKGITAEMHGSGADTEQTDFSSLTASFAIASGVVRNNDLALKAPLLDVTGQGTVDLPGKTVDYRLRPTVVGSIEGETRAEDAERRGVTIPVRVTGTFDRLEFKPDAGGLAQDLAKDPEGTLKNLEDDVRGVRDDLKSLFKGL